MSRVRHIAALGVIAEQQAAQNLRLKALLRRARNQIQLVDAQGNCEERGYELVRDINDELNKKEAE